MRPCPLCGNTHALTFWGKTKIVHCPRCSLRYVDPLPSLEELAAMYAEPFFCGDSAYANYIAERTSLQRNFQKRIDVLRRYSASGRLYEVGCAYGFFLELARAYWEVEGCDISAEAVQYAREQLALNVTVDDYEGLAQSPASYDVIAMWDTIEHLYDPFLAAQKCCDALRPGGILALTTGDVGALYPRLAGVRWRLIHYSHLYYFSRASVTRLLKAAGLEVVHVSYPGNSRSLLQMAMALTYSRTERNWRQTLFHALEKLPWMERLHFSVNFYDIMFVIARKSLQNGG